MPGLFKALMVVALLLVAAPTLRAAETEAEADTVASAIPHSVASPAIVPVAVSTGAANPPDTVRPRPAYPQFDPTDSALGLRSTLNAGTVWVGGRVRMAEYYARYNQGLPSSFAGGRAVTPGEFTDAWNHRNRDRHVSRFQTRDVNLDFRVDASDKASLHIGLDLDDAWDDVYGQDDFLDHAYFELRELFGRNLSLKIGKQKMPFGLHRDDLLVSPWTVAQPLYGFDGWFNNDNMTASRIPGDLDNVFGLTADYKFLRDLARFELGVFQTRDGRTQYGRHTADDFGSVATRLTLAPLEQFKLYASFANLHNDAGPARPHGRDNQQWYSIGVEGKLFTVLPLAYFAEYQAGDGNDYLDRGKSHDLHLGLIWELAARWRLNLQGEWLRTRSHYLYAADPTHPAAGATRQQTDLYRTLLAAEYDLTETFTLEGGWQHEWLRAKYDAMAVPGSAGGPARLSGRGDLFYAGMKYQF